MYKCRKMLKHKGTHVYMVICMVADLQSLRYQEPFSFLWNLKDHHCIHRSLHWFLSLARWTTPASSHKVVSIQGCEKVARHRFSVWHKEAIEEDCANWRKSSGYWGATIFFIASGVGLSPLYCGHFWPIVPASDDRWEWLWSNWWNEDWQGKPKYLEKTCPNATLSTTHHEVQL
jgi:hypothetical protein